MIESENKLKNNKDKLIKTLFNDDNDEEKAHVIIELIDFKAKTNSIIVKTNSDISKTIFMTLSIKRYRFV